MRTIRQMLICALLVSCFQSMQAHLTITEIMEIMKGVRSTCQAETGAEDDIVDGINFGHFPKDQKLMCYLHCVLKQLNMLRKGKLKADLAIKQINMFMPPEIREAWVSGVEKCKNAGDDKTDQCERIGTLVECFYHNNDHFMLP